MRRIKQLVKNTPFLGWVAGYTYGKWINPQTPFINSESYWVRRYERGGNSGNGSYNQRAEFKAEVINSFVEQNCIGTVIEFGCGDGNQLRLANYPSYVGYDISPKALEICRKVFRNDATKAFKMLRDHEGETAELTLSLDVIYHLVEDEVFFDYMHRLFDSSTKWVIVYSSDTDDNEGDQDAHVKHRNFTKWVEANKPGWSVLKQIPNRFPYDRNSKTGSFSDFFIYGTVSRDIRS